MLYDRPTISFAHEPTVMNINLFIGALLEYATPGRQLVECFPSMENIPSSIAKWKREAEERYQYYSRHFEDMFREVKHQIVMFFVPLRRSPQFATHLYAVQNQGDERLSFSGSLI